VQKQPKTEISPPKPSAIRTLPSKKFFAIKLIKVIVPIKIRGGLVTSSKESPLKHRVLQKGLMNQFGCSGSGQKKKWFSLRGIFSK